MFNFEKDIDWCNREIPLAVDRVAKFILSLFYEKVARMDYNLFLNKKSYFYTCQYSGKFHFKYEVSEVCVTHALSNNISTLIYKTLFPEMNSDFVFNYICSYDYKSQINSRVKTELLQFMYNHNSNSIHKLSDIYLNLDGDNLFGTIYFKFKFADKNVHFEGFNT